MFRLQKSNFFCSFLKKLHRRESARLQLLETLHQEGPLRQHRAIGRHHNVHRHRRQDTEEDYRPGALYHDDQDHRAAIEKVSSCSCSFSSTKVA